jgi:hypothetical protein
MVRLKVPVGVEADVFTVRVDWPVPFIEVGLNDVVVFAGTPEIVSPVVPEKPFSAVTEMVYEVLFARTTVRLGGEPEMVKSGMVTTSVTVVEWVIVPSVPVTVRV